MFKLKTVQELLDRELSRETTEEDFDSYHKYVAGIRNRIKGGVSSDEEKILLINRLFFSAKRNVLAAGKKVYRPSKKDIENVLGIYSSVIDNLCISLPEMKYVNFSVTNFNTFDTNLTIYEEGRIIVLPPYFLVDRTEEKLTVNEEVAHHSLSDASFSLVSERGDSLWKVYERLGADLYADKKFEGDVKEELEKLRRGVEKYARRLEYKYPTRALVEGAPLFLVEKSVRGERLHESFLEYIKFLESSSDYYSKFKLLGYKTLKNLEEKSPEAIKKLYALRDDLQLFDLAGIDVKSLGVLSGFYEK